MAKPDPALLDPARYPYSCAIETRFGDLDVNLHLNNVALAGILEDGRVRYLAALGGRTSLATRSMMVVSIAIDYLGQGRYPEPLTMHAGGLKVGRTSLEIAQMLTQDGRVILFARATLVSMGSQGPAPLPSGFVTDFEAWMITP